MSETSVASDFEKSFDIFSQFCFKNVGGNLKILSLLIIFLSVKEPPGNAMTFGIVDDIGNRVALGFGEFSCSESRIDSEDLADEESESSANSLNSLKSEGDSSLTIDVGVEDTMNMLESVVSVFNDQRHLVWN